MANVNEVLCFGFSAHAPGQTYPAICISGWVSGVYSLWRCDDFNPASLGSETWTNIGATMKGTLDTPQCIGGDPNQWGRFIVGTQGGGFSICQVSGQANTWP